MNPVKKMNAVAAHYKIAGWDKFTNSEKMAAVKDRTGCTTIDAAYNKMEADKKGNVKSVTPIPVVGIGDKLDKIESRSTQLAHSLQKAATILPPPVPKATEIMYPTIQVAAASPVVIEPRREPPQWWELMGRTGYWVQVFFLGLLCGVVFHKAILTLATFQ